MFPSKLKEEKIHEIVAPFPKKKLVDCCSSSTMDENVLETDKTKRFDDQSWDALKTVCFTKFCGSTVVSFLQKCRTAYQLIGVSGTRLTWNLTPTIV